MNFLTKRMDSISFYFMRKEVKISRAIRRMNDFIDKIKREKASNDYADEFIKQLREQDRKDYIIDCFNEMRDIKREMKIIKTKIKKMEVVVSKTKTLKTKPLTLLDLPRDIIGLIKEYIPVDRDLMSPTAPLIKVDVLRLHLDLISNRHHQHYLRDLNYNSDNNLFYIQARDMLSGVLTYECHTYAYMRHICNFSHLKWFKNESRESDLWKAQQYSIEYFSDEPVVYE